MRHHSVRKWKYIMRFEIRYFFLEIKPEGLNPISRKKHLISNLIIYFHFPRACMRQYTVRASTLVPCMHIIACTGIL